MGVIGDAIRGAVQGATELAPSIRDAITGESAKIKFRELENQLLVAQAEINKAEAKSTNWFVAGWRPALGWCGALAISYKFLLRPLLVGFGVTDLPDVDASELYPLIIGMLGLGVYRTYEKREGVQDRH